MAMIDKIRQYFQEIVIGVLALILGATVGYFKGCYDGEEKTDTKWRTEIAAGAYKEVRRDTIVQYVPIKPTTGNIGANPVPVTEAYQKAIDSLKSVIQNKDTLIFRLLSPKTATFETPALGSLNVTYWPAVERFTYTHFPPPEKIRTVTVEKEKIVLTPRSTWETIQKVVTGAVIGGTIAYVTLRLAR
jgi:hypothetical protein